MSRLSLGMRDTIGVSDLSQIMMNRSFLAVVILAVLLNVCDAQRPNKRGGGRGGGGGGPGGGREGGGNGGLVMVMASMECKKAGMGPPGLEILKKSLMATLKENESANKKTMTQESLDKLMDKTKESCKTGGMTEADQAHLDTCFAALKVKASKHLQPGEKKDEEKKEEPKEEEA